MNLYEFIKYEPVNPLKIGKRLYNFIDQKSEYVKGNVVDKITVSKILGKLFSFKKLLPAYYIPADAFIIIHTNSNKVDFLPTRFKFNKEYLNLDTIDNEYSAEFDYLRGKYKNLSSEDIKVIIYYYVNVPKYGKNIPLFQEYIPMEAVK